MKLRIKITSLLVALLIFLGLSYFWFFAKVIGPSFIKLEEREAISNINRVLRTIDREYDELIRLSLDWAIWDEIYIYMDLYSDKFVEGNLKENIYEINNLNLLNYYDNNGKLIWGSAFDLEFGEYFFMKDFVSDSLPLDHPLLDIKFQGEPSAKNIKKGIWQTEYGPMMTISQPLLSNIDDGVFIGFLVIGRLLKKTVVERIAKQTNVEFELFNYVPERFPRQLRKILENRAPGESFHIDRVGRNELQIYAGLQDITQKSWTVVKVSMAREVYGRSLIVMNYAISTFIFTIIVVFVLASIVLQKIVLGPVTLLTEQVLEIGQSGVGKAEISIEADDEIGVLVKEFNTMMNKLADAKIRFQDEAFQQGVSELATGMMHSVRNSLLKLYSTTELMQKEIGLIPAKDFDLAHKELNSSNLSDERKAELISFINEGNKKLLLFLSQIREKLNLNMQVQEEIEVALRKYEKWAYAERRIEKINIGNILSEAYQSLRSNYRGQVTLDVPPEIETIGEVESNRVILTQVLINIFANAVESVRETGRSHGIIRVEAIAIDDKIDSKVHLRILDNGAGIKNNIFQHMFDRGFSTKVEGESFGLGLHWCRNALTTLNGEIYAERIDKGRGACFHLILPRTIAQPQDL